MAHYIDADKIYAEIERLISISKVENGFPIGYVWKNEAYKELLSFLHSLQQEQQMPDSTQLIAEWEKEKAVLEQKDFRGDAERMAYNAFLDGFVKGLGYEGTR